jgi:phage FluMu protein Com
MAELFKFRCFQCQKLIGAPASRFGSVVKCPRCGAELIVPSPRDEASPEPEPDPDAFRLEDLGLRIEPEPIISKPTVTAPAPIARDGPDPVAFLSQLDETGEYPAREAPDEPGGPEPEGGEAPDFPEPEIEPLVPRKRARSASQIVVGCPRARDVVLPRTAAVAWALSALLGLAFAFLSGLLLGQRLGK